RWRPAGGRDKNYCTGCGLTAVCKRVHCSFCYTSFNKFLLATYFSTIFCITKEQTKSFVYNILLIISKKNFKLAGFFLRIAKS
ncbi:MAG: hypothetical protein VZR04_02920, partial [Succiniclasticum sp.]|nr:hypothetical protein [Succiniclasticum sp.]